MSNLTIVKCSASWCNPCKALSLVLAPLLDSYPNVAFKDIDIEEDDDFAVVNNIRNVPTTIFYIDDKEVHRFTGTKNKKELIELIEKYEKTICID